MRNGAPGDRLDHVLPQASGFGDVRFGDEHALSAGQAEGATGVEEALYLFVDPSDGLDLAFLVDRTGYCDVLPERHAGERGEKGVELPSKKRCLRRPRRSSASKARLAERASGTFCAKRARK